MYGEVPEQFYGLDAAEWYKEPEQALFFELFIAYLEARLGKRKTFDEHKFEANEWENLRNLHQSVLDRTYAPSRGTAHIIHRPVIREIFAAPFRDRVIHHFIYDNIYEWWDRHLLFDAYSCREGKGTLAGINRLYRCIQRVSEDFRKEVWVLKFDIAGYFMHLPRQGLYERAVWGLDRQFGEDRGWRYQTLRFLLKQIIFDDPCWGVIKKGKPSEWRQLPDSKSMFKQPPGQGIVIGNLTSQLLSNIYLDLLDRYIVYDLGFADYGRYVDDFYIVVPERQLEHAKWAIAAIETKLETMGLTLHPRKRRIQPASRGVEFLGSVIYPGRKIVGRRLKRNFRVALREYVMGHKKNEVIISYLGHMRHMDSDRLISKLFREVGWDYRP